MPNISITGDFSTVELVSSLPVLLSETDCHVAQSLPRIIQFWPRTKRYRTLLDTHDTPSFAGRYATNRDAES